MKNEVEYNHQCVADLAWALSSPALLYAGNEHCEWFNDSWYLQLYRELRPELVRLDNDPAELQMLLQAEKDQRLGNYFETLWACALGMSSRFDLLERNLQVRDGERTHGEFDFIVLDRESGRCAHWELAIKFYLGLGDTCEHHAWHGPGRKDRLDLKVGHLNERQTLLSQNPLARKLLNDRGIEIDECAVILKGRLFYPDELPGSGQFPRLANPSHLRGIWMTRDRFRQVFATGEAFTPLIRQGWMASLPTSDKTSYFSVETLLTAVDQGNFRLPMHLFRHDAPTGEDRIFLVDNNWPDIQT